MNKKDKKHVLAGIISKRVLGQNCDRVRNQIVMKSFRFFFQPAPGVYTYISRFIGWLKKEIKLNGGMATCEFNISSSPALGDI